MVLVRDIHTPNIAAPTAGGPSVRFLVGVCLAIATLATNGAQADPTDNWLRTYVIQMLYGPAQSIGGAGVYVGKGLVITAAHVGGDGVRINDINMPAKMVKGGTFETIDLALFSIEEEQLPINLRLLRMPLSQRQLPVGSTVIVASPQRITRSHIASPMLLPPGDRSKFSTLISDTETGGRSGSGVFDAEQKCLLGILTLLISNKINNKNIASYFVPASTILSFVPLGTRW
jgi:hypothetical protein